MKNKNAGLDQAILQEYNGAVTWDINYKTSHIRFLVTQRNLLARPFRKIEGNFRDYSAIVQTIADDFTDGAIDFSIIVDSINTGNAKRDKHLASSDFFDSAKFPVIKFHGVSFEKEKKNNYILEGNCTIHGLTRRLVFEVNYEGTKQNEWGDIIAVFMAATRVSLHDFGFKLNPLMEAFIGKEVTILINLELARKPQIQEVKEKLKPGMTVH